MIKKSLFLLLIFVFLQGCGAEEKDECGILPPGINYKIVLNSELYFLTEHGLVPKGFFIDFEKWRGRMEWPTLDRVGKAIYFSASLKNDDNILNGIYKIDLTRRTAEPVFVIRSDDERTPTNPIVSPDGKMLIFYLLSFNKESNYIIKLLNIRTGELRELVDDAYGAIRPTWINGYQFIYYSDGGKLFLFDVKTLEKVDLKMSGYAPGAVTPNGKHILLSGHAKTLLYNISAKTVDTILINNSIDVNNMFWLPDGKGFIYYKFTWEDNMTLIFGDGIGGIAYYSLDKMKDVKLIEKSTLTGGFVVPPDINLNPVDNALNRRMLLSYKNSSDGARSICKKK